MNKTFNLRFLGNKDCVGRKCGGFFIGGMRNGSAYDTNGVVFGRYRRIVTDGGSGDLQEIEFTIELER